jgi:adenylate kinase
MGENAMNLVLLGPPGAGKGTQAALLIKAYNVLHISTGDMLRETVKEGSELGKKIEGFMNSGELAPDEIVNQVVVERISKDDAKNGFMLDGYPRTNVQGEALDGSMKEHDKKLDMVLYFKTSDEVAIQRLSGRRVCPECGKNYHATNMPPVKENICDKCGVELFQRDDDKPETVKNRLKVYEEKTSGLIKYYKDKGLLREVDGDTSADKLFEDIDTLFKEEGLINDSSN